MGLFAEKKIGKSIINWLPIGSGSENHEEVYDSWCKSNLIFKEENKTNDVKGLRSPQIGGAYSALGYSKSDGKGPATIVMPTGTGKTETMLTIVVAGKFKKTLVLVPSDALRDQTRRKFVELGLLRELGLIKDDILNPIVSTIKHGIKDECELNQVLMSNVIVSSASALSKFSNEYLSRLTRECSHLIIDEAHHVTAITWAKVKKSFLDKPIFQFTATPFRSDGSRVEGKIIFNYPLKNAQKDGYFKPIEFHPVREFVDEESDKSIANKAICLLRSDLESGLDHIVMARARTIKRAKEIFELYAIEKDLNPVLINSKTNSKKEVLERINSGFHKIIVCVNMLGEGFDLPNLKISAIHDPHKSINIMLQFTGRFTRVNSTVGNAKFIANIANPNVNDSLEELYKEDSDWNSLISDISARKIDNEKEYQNFKADFSNVSKLLDLGLTPSTSTTLYKMNKANWRPNEFHLFERKNILIMDSAINDDETILIFSVKSFLPVGWAASKELFDETWDLYIAYYNTETDLLFIHSSAKDGLVKRLADVIAKNSKQVKGEYIFRAFSGLRRMKLQNIGLNKNKKGLRYSMHTGTEINEQIPDIEAHRAIKSNIFGKGYENGDLVSIGGSYKGKVWAMDSDSLEKWIDWCKSVGRKVLDESIDTNQVFKTAMQTEELNEFPKIPVLSIEWPVDILRKNESTLKVITAGLDDDFINCELVVFNSQIKSNDEFDFYLVTSHGKNMITVKIESSGDFSFYSENDIRLMIGEHCFDISEFFCEHSPTFFLADTSILDSGLRYYSNENYAYLYDKNNIEHWDWSGIDISRESQTERKIKNSIQSYTIRKIEENYDVVFDDDGSGEVADIVAIKNVDNEELIIDFFHCKYCSKKNGVATPGKRIDDIYQVAGQAEKSVKWFSDKEKLILRLIDRERGRLSKNKSSRIDKGRYEDLVNIAKVARYAKFKLGISIVQPAVSKLLISDDQLSVLGATAAYIEEVSGIKLRVIINQ